MLNVSGHTYLLHPNLFVGIEEVATYGGLLHGSRLRLLAVLPDRSLEHSWTLRQAPDSSS
mgnify:CR=1 FL=1